MANLIDTTYFIGGENHVPQIADSSVIADVEKLIAFHENDLLELLLGYSLNKQFKAGLTEATPDDKWNELKNGVEFTNRFNQLDKWNGFCYTIESKKFSPIADYVFYKILVSKASEFTASGEAEVKGTNFNPVDGRARQANAWNRMVKSNKQLFEFMYVKQDVYPEFMDNYYSQACKHGHLYRVINSLGI